MLPASGFFCSFRRALFAFRIPLSRILMLSPLLCNIDSYHLYLSLTGFEPLLLPELVFFQLTSGRAK